MIEELAVGAQFKLPYIHMVVNNSYLGLIRQSQRGFSMDYCVQLGFDNINVDAGSSQGYGVDHVKVVEGLGCKAMRVHKQEEIAPAIEQAEAWMAEFKVPVVIEVMLERVTNISMGTEIDNINEFEELAPTSRKRTHGASTADSACSDVDQEATHAQVRRQPDDAVHRGAVPRPLRARRQGRLQGRRVPVPVCLRRAPRSGSGSTTTACSWCCTTCRAGDWDAGERGIACLPDRVDEFRAGVARGDRVRHGAGRAAAQLPGRQGAGRRRRRECCASTFVANLHFAAAAAEGARA